MKFSQLAVSAFLASSAFAVPVADPDVVTVVETAQDVDYVTDVQNVYVTVVAGEQSSAAPAPSPDVAQQQDDVVVTVTAEPPSASPTSESDVTYVEATVYVDQNGNLITLDAESSAPATSTTPATSVAPTTSVAPASSSASPLSFYTYRHKHSNVESSPVPVSTSSSTTSSDVVVVTVSVDSNGAIISSDSFTSVAPTTTEEAPAPTTSSVEEVPTPVITTVEEVPTSTTSSVEEVTTSTSAPVQETQSVVEDSAASVPDSSSDSSSDNLDSFASACTDLHNSLRAKHSAQPLTWNSTLADFAKGYLSKQNCVFAHSNGPYGENIAMGYPTPDKAIQAWYDEIKDYDFSAGQFSMSTGHFTQVVWKDTTQVGCQMYDCGSGSGNFLACEYYPAGNVIGYFLENVIA